MFREFAQNCMCTVFFSFTLSSPWDFHIIVLSHLNQQLLLTCALFNAGSFLQSIAVKFAVKIVFPEFSKPDIPPVVFQRSPDEVIIKPWDQTGHISAKVYRYSMS